MRSTRSRSSFAQAQPHVVLLVELGVAEARHLGGAADQQPQRAADVLRLHAEFGGARPVDHHPQFGPPQPQRRVQALHRAELHRLGAQAFDRSASVGRSGPRIAKSSGNGPPPRLMLRWLLTVTRTSVSLRSRCCTSFITSRCV
jgi:hypothetical protein